MTRRPEIFHAIRRYVGRFQTARDEVRTERFLNSLPSDLRRDIGWPDTWPERCARRR